MNIGEHTVQETIRVTEINLMLLGADLVDVLKLGSIPMDAFSSQLMINKHKHPDIEGMIANEQVDDDLKYVANDYLNAIPMVHEEIADATRRDTILSRLYDYVKNGWPFEIPFNKELESFYNVKDGLTIEKGCIIFGARVVILNALQKRCLDQLHKGHPGIINMKAKARCCIYWPLIETYIVKVVNNCNTCQVAVKDYQKTKS